MGTPKRPSSATLMADRAALVDLQNLLDYTPRNPACSTPALIELENTLTRTEEAEARARWAYEEMRREADRVATDFHAMMLSAKVEVLNQYGRESHALHAVGLKPRSDYRRPPRRSKPTEV